MHDYLTPRGMVSDSVTPPFGGMLTVPIGLPEDGVPSGIRPEVGPGTDRDPETKRLTV